MQNYTSADVLYPPIPKMIISKEILTIAHTLAYELGNDLFCNDSESGETIETMDTFEVENKCTR